MWISQTSPEQSKQKPRPKKWFHESRTILRAPREKSENDKLFITALRIRHPATIPISMQVFHFNIIYAICTNQTPENYAMNNECILLGTLINYTTTVYNEYLLLWNLYSILSLTQTNLWSPEAYFGVAI